MTDHFLITEGTNRAGSLAAKNSNCEQEVPVAGIILDPQGFSDLWAVELAQELLLERYNRLQTLDKVLVYLRVEGRKTRAEIVS